MLKIFKLGERMAKREVKIGIFRVLCRSFAKGATCKTLAGRICSDNSFAFPSGLSHKTYSENKPHANTLYWRINTNLYFITFTWLNLIIKETIHVQYFQTDWNNLQTKNRIKGCTLHILYKLYTFCQSANASCTLSTNLQHVWLKLLTNGGVKTLHQRTNFHVFFIKKNVFYQHQYFSW